MGDINLPLKTIIRALMIAIGLIALWSAFINIRGHNTYAVASRLALFSAALYTFANPTGLERLIKNRPIIAIAIGTLFVIMICAYYFVFFVRFPPPK